MTIFLSPLSGAVLSSKARSDRDLERSRSEARRIIHALHKAQDKMDELEVKNKMIFLKKFSWFIIAFLHPCRRRITNSRQGKSPRNLIEENSNTIKYQWTFFYF